MAAKGGEDDCKPLEFSQSPQRDINFLEYNFKKASKADAMHTSVPDA